MHSAHVSLSLLGGPCVLDCDGLIKLLCMRIRYQSADWNGPHARASALFVFRVHPTSMYRLNGTSL